MCVLFRSLSTSLIFCMFTYNVTYIFYNVILIIYCKCIFERFLLKSTPLNVKHAVTVKLIGIKIIFT